MLLHCTNCVGGDVDYDSGPYSITFPAGVTNMSFDIFINDDEILEENETFFLHIITLPKGVSTGHLNQTMITVLDDDSKWMITNLYSSCILCLSCHCVLIYNYISLQAYKSRHMTVCCVAKHSQCRHVTDKCVFTGNIRSYSA